MLASMNVEDDILLTFLARWEKLNLVRVYTKPKGKLPDYTAPVVLRANRATVEDFVSRTIFVVHLSSFAPFAQFFCVILTTHSVTQFIKVSSPISKEHLFTANLQGINLNGLASITNSVMKISVRPSNKNGPKVEVFPC